MKFRIFIFTLMATISSQAYSEIYKGGATIVPISDGLPTSTFNLKTDAASVYLEKAILIKENGWFTTDKEVAVTARMTINSQKKNRTSSSLTITRVYKFDVSVYKDGRIEVPLKSLPLLDTFLLSGDDYLVTSIVVDLFLSKKKEKNGFSKTLETLIKVSKQIPVPGNPYAEYASVFGDAFSSVIDEAIKEGADTVPFASFGLRFLQGKMAENYTEKSGVHAIIIGSSETKSGIVNIETMNKKQLSYDDIGGLKYNNSKVLNNHLIVRVTASTDPWLAMASLSETLKILETEIQPAVAFSRANNLSTPALKAFEAAFNNQSFKILASRSPEKLEESIKELNAIRAINPLEAGIILPLKGKKQ